MAVPLPNADQVRGWIRVLRGRRRDERWFLVATLLAGAALSIKLWPEEVLRLVLPYHPALVLVGLAALAYGVWLVRIWRQAQAPRRELIDRPAAVKGPASFGPQDGELFQGLGRADELRKLLGHVLDDQIGLVVLMGESGAGKTSLLRSGLPYVLGTQKAGTIPCLYWEALPSDPEARLLEAIERQFDPPEAAPSTLAALAELDDAPRVIVIDQLEQLDPHLPTHAALFELLRQVGERRPPFRVTWILAFRREFAPVWFDFEIAHPGLRFKKTSLDLFHPAAAEEVLATLGEAADLTLDRGLVAELVRSATNAGGRVSPVDLGIGLLLLHELARTRHTDSLSLRDYRFAGGSDFLLAGYLLRCLSDLAEEDRSALLKSLLLLVDLRANQRVAEGKTVAELADEAGRPSNWMTHCLAPLMDGRVLERIGDRLRLQHERLIPPLRALSGELLAEADRARIVLQDAYGRWLRHSREGELLHGADLRLILRHRRLLLTRHPETTEFLRKSSRRRRAWQATAAAGLVVALFGAWAGGLAVRRSNDQAALLAAGLPTDLLDHLGHLQILHLSVPTNNLNWIRVPLQELEISGVALLEPPPLPSSLKSLTINGGNPSLVAALPFLPHLETLRVRSIPLGQLPPLGRFPRLRRLEISLRDYPPSNMLASLESRTGLEELTLTSRSSDDDYSDDAYLRRVLVPSIRSLRRLTVGSRVRLPQAGLPRLETLKVNGADSGLFPGRGPCDYARRFLPNVKVIVVSEQVPFRFPALNCFPRLEGVRGFPDATPYLEWLTEGVIPCYSIPDYIKNYPRVRSGLLIYPEQCDPGSFPQSLEAITLIAPRDLNAAIDRLSGLKHLRTLVLRQIIFPLSLRSLNATATRLSSIKSLTLETVDLASLADLRFFSGLEELTIINTFVFDPHVDSIGNISFSPPGSKLIMESAPLTTFKGFPPFSKLRFLSVPKAGISDLRKLPKLPKLESLNLEGNHLKSLKGLPTTVRELYL